MRMATPYKVLTDGVVDKLEGFGYAGITETEIEDIMLPYIRSAAVKFKACRQDLNLRDDELRMFFADLTDEETEILTNFMLIEYLSANYINTPLLMKPSLTSKDMNAFSPERHLSGLVNWRDTLTRETRQMIGVYSLSGSELFDSLKEKLKIEN